MIVFSINCAVEPVQKQIFTWTFYLQKTQEHVQDKPLPGEVTEHVVMETTIKNGVLAAGPQVEPLVSDMHCLKITNFNRYFFLKKMKWHFKLFVGIPEHNMQRYIFFFLGGGVSFSWYLMTCLFVNLLFRIYFRKKKVTQTKRGRLRNNKRKDTVSYAGYLAVDEKETNFILHFNHLTYLQWCPWTFSVSNLFISFYQ